MFARSRPTPKSHFPMRKLYKFYLRLLHPKAIAEKRKNRRLLFFLTSSLIFEMSISGGSAKRQRYFFFGIIPVAWYFFSKEYFFSTEDARCQGSHFPICFFVLFTEILLKSRVCLQPTRHPPLAQRLKAGLARTRTVLSVLAVGELWSYNRKVLQQGPMGSWKEPPYR